MLLSVGKEKTTFSAIMVREWGGSEGEKVWAGAVARTFPAANLARYFFIQLASRLAPDALRAAIARTVSLVEADQWLEDSDGDDATEKSIGRIKLNESARGVVSSSAHFSWSVVVRGGFRRCHAVSNAAITPFSGSSHV